MHHVIPNIEEDAFFFIKTIEDQKSPICFVSIFSLDWMVIDIYKNKKKKCLFLFPSQSNQQRI